MNKLDRYIFNQVSMATILGIVVFIIAWISPEILFKIIKQAVYGQISVAVAVKLFFLEIPEILGKAIPVGLMIGSLFVFDRLSKDSELAIIRSIGVSFNRLVLPVLFLGTIGMVACYFTYENMIPYSNSTIKNLKDNISQSHFVYVDKTKTGKPRQVFIIGNYDGSRVKNVKLLKFSQVVSSDTPLIQNIITADKGYWMGNHWTLEKGIEYDIAPDGVYKSVKPFDKKEVLSAEAAIKSYKLLMFSTKKSSEMTSAELAYYVELLRNMDIQDEYRYMLNKYHQRYAQSFSCILLAICGVILGFNKPREKRFLGFTIGIGIVFMYYLIIPFLDMLAQNAIILPSVAAWIPNFMVMGSVMVLVKYKQI